MKLYSVDLRINQDYNGRTAGCIRHIQVAQSSRDSTTQTGWRWPLCLKMAGFHGYLWQLWRGFWGSPYCRDGWTWAGPASAWCRRLVEVWWRRPCPAWAWAASSWDTPVWWTPSWPCPPPSWDAPPLLSTWTDRVRSRENKYCKSLSSGCNALLPCLLFSAV